MRTLEFLCGLEIQDGHHLTGGFHHHVYVLYIFQLFFTKTTGQFDSNLSWNVPMTILYQIYVFKSPG